MGVNYPSGHCGGWKLSGWELSRGKLFRGICHGGQLSGSCPNNLYNMRLFKYEEQEVHVALAYKSPPSGYRVGVALGLARLVGWRQAL